MGAGPGCRPWQVDRGVEWERLMKELAGVRALEQPALRLETMCPPVRDDLLLRRGGD